MCFYNQRTWQGNADQNFRTFVEITLFATIIWKQEITEEKYSKQTNTCLRSTIITLNIRRSCTFLVNFELFSTLF